MRVGVVQVDLDLDLIGAVVFARQGGSHRSHVRLEHGSAGLLFRSLLAGPRDAYWPALLGLVAGSLKRMNPILCFVMSHDND